MECLNQLENLQVDVKGAKAVAGFMSDYFGKLEPDALHLKNRFLMYQDLSAVLIHLIVDIEKNLDAITNDIAKAK